MQQQIQLEQAQAAFQELRQYKTMLASKGWFPATSGNMSVRIGDHTGQSDFVFAVTSSGKDKSLNTPEDFLLVNQDGQPIQQTSLKPSAETLIHCEIYKATGCGAVFHVHTLYNNLISEWYAGQGQAHIPIQGIELIKAFNIWEEDARIEVPILPNYADIPKIAALVKDAIVPQIPGIVLRNHGIYAWGANAFEAKRHLEAFEFLFEYMYRWLILKQAANFPNLT
ncbi:methylthioribulose 1-phosphate dehydratase [Paenibacillus senegalensis]|uniref:methylthioribulose 1-phosphate dehydratase n=1 Tax=Paenibacillus senegalensis TaxID=1465766 RepID=UPI0002893F81|nr:methylthioribulose 1-phosphate dehydratase [Paenibacillus senegalensis]